jgi:hypothetical protein
MSDEKKPRGCFFYGCAFSAGIAAILVAVFGGIYYYGTRSIAPVAEKFLTLVDSGDYNGAYGMLGAGWKQTATLEQFTAFETQIKDALGACNSKTMSGVSINNTNGVTSARLVYSANFTKGAATLTFNLIKEGDDWKVQGLTYNSDLLKGGLPKPADPNAPSEPKQPPLEAPAPPAETPAEK